jgi:HEAT repeat protein
MSLIDGAIRALKEPGDRKRRVTQAETLSALVQRCPAAASGAGTVQELASLLGDPEDAVRFWVAGALGFIGPKAAAAIPALEKALDERKGAMGSLTSVEAIRVALERIRRSPKIRRSSKPGRPG